MFGTTDPKNSRLGGVTCTVATCAHHGPNNCCKAQGIKVGTEYAQNRTETFCSTFSQNAE